MRVFQVALNFTGGVCMCARALVSVLKFIVGGVGGGVNEIQEN